MSRFLNKLKSPNIPRARSQRIAYEKIRSLLLNRDHATLRELSQQAMDDMESAYPYLGHGNQRRVFDGGDVVYKVPAPEGAWATMTMRVMASLEEVWGYQHGYNEIPVMPCRLVWHKTGIPIVVMEKYRRQPSEAGHLPTWRHRVDGAQVAWSAWLGEWAAYDAGYPPMLCDFDQWRDDVRSRAEAAMGITA